MLKREKRNKKTFKKIDNYIEWHFVNIFIFYLFSFTNIHDMTAGEEGGYIFNYSLPLSPVSPTFIH